MGVKEDFKEVYSPFFDFSGLGCPFHLVPPIVAFLLTFYFGDFYLSQTRIWSSFGPRTSLSKFFFTGVNSVSRDLFESLTV